MSDTRTNKTKPALHCGALSCDKALPDGANFCPFCGRESEGPWYVTKWRFGNRDASEVVSGPFVSRKRAYRAMDRKDNEYGAYVHSVRTAKDLGK